jgi:hypothetical protein
MTDHRVLLIHKFLKVDDAVRGIHFVKTGRRLPAPALQAAAVPPGS